MAEDSVRFALDDGEMLLVPNADLRRIYDSLLEISNEPGAVSTCRHRDGRVAASCLRPCPVELSGRQSAVLRKAVALLRAY
jgi:hypothetical protein